MSLELTVDNLDGINEAHQGLYTKTESGYVLGVNVDKHPDLVAMRNKNAELLNESKSAKEKARTEEAQRLEEQRKLEEQKLTASGDIDKIKEHYSKQESEWETKHNTEVTRIGDEYKVNTDKLTSQVKTLAMGSTAGDIARELGGDAFYMGLLPHIQNRLGVDMSGDKPVARVINSDGSFAKDAGGNYTTFDELKNEFKANELFKGMILANKSSGTGTQEQGRSFTNSNDANRKPGLGGLVGRGK